MAVQNAIRDKQVAAALAFLQAVFEDIHPRDFAVRFWDGSVWEAETDEPRFTIVLKHPGALRLMFRDLSTDLSMGEAYIYDDFDIEGDIFEVYRLADRLLDEADWSVGDKLRLGQMLLRLPKGDAKRKRDRAARLSGKRHSVDRDRQAIQYHYDVPSEFYALWLDKNMVYSCAYFKTGEEDIDTAQEQKLDYICRKLRLKPGERLLDIGCGWGGLVIYAAKHYGVEAVGITLSENQYRWANERIKQEGLEGRARVELRDYREVNEPEGYDKLVSVGMFEHVGEEMLPVYFQQAYKLLKPGGVFLNHGIAREANVPWQRNTFGDKYVFPDGELEPIWLTLKVAQEVGFEVRDVESLREHYALTLRHWVQRLEAHHEEALKYVDEVTYRIWRLFMSGSSYNFLKDHHELYQTLLVKSEHGPSGLPWTREDWYCRQ
ncbi:MAG TPA: class I SAM-dependent methyltransferase [Chloroflexi bacterium]|nr:class I SAM-dependent methyltransferase [Chloroflexota bacterium]